MTSAHGQGQPNLTAFYMSRVETHLSGITDAAARRVFLKSQIENFQNLYETFVVQEGDGFPADTEFGKPTAFDFVLTIAALDARLSYEMNTESNHA